METRLICEKTKSCNYKYIVYSQFYLFHSKVLNMHMCAQTHQNSIHPVWNPLPIPMNISFTMRTAIMSTCMAHCVMINDIMTLACPDFWHTWTILCSPSQFNFTFLCHFTSSLYCLCPNSITRILGFQ